MAAAALTALGLVAAILILYEFDPAEGRYPVCPFHYLTGLHCPGCGTLRALHQLLHGNVAAALSLNLLSTIAIPILLVGLIRSRVGGAKQTPAPPVAGRRWPIHPAWLVVIVIVAFGVLRNVPLYPFTLLAPH